jgi:hypothetical protein
LTVRYAKGSGFDANKELLAWFDHDEAGFTEAGYAYARLEMVSRYGLAEAAEDAWGDLFLYRQGRLRLIYAAKKRRRGGAVLVLHVTDMRGAKTAEPYEREARRRLKEIGSW